MADGTPIIIKKKKIVAGGHHGGSWKVAYADFVTAMMAFFMVMWIMGMDSSTRSTIQGYFNDPFGILKSSPATKTPFALPGSPAPKDFKGSGAGGANGETQGDHMRDATQLESIEQQIKNQAETAAEAHPEVKALLEHMEMQLTEEGLRVEFVETAGSVFFLSGDDTIRPEARELIRAVAPVFAESHREIIVEGHTDAEPYRHPVYTNWDLSTDRAQSMRRLLASYGVNGKQFVEVRGYADTKLKRPEAPLHFSNRRVSVLLPFRTIDPVQFDLPRAAIKEDIQGLFVQPAKGR